MKETNLKKIISIIAINENLKFYEFAEKVGMSESMLRKICSGERNPPLDLIDKINNNFELEESVQCLINYAIINSLKSIKLDLSNETSIEKKELAYRFAKKFDELSKDEIEKIRQMLI